jgi:hypothetical protein
MDDDEWAVGLCVGPAPMQLQGRTKFLARKAGSEEGRRKSRVKVQKRTSREDRTNTNPNDTEANAAGRDRADENKYFLYMKIFVAK